MAGTPCRLLHVSPRDMRALRIFHADSHPSRMGLGGRKEGFSLLALLDRCATTMVRRSPQTSGAPMLNGICDLDRS